MVENDLQGEKKYISSRGGIDLIMNLNDNFEAERFSLKRHSLVCQSSITGSNQIIQARIAPAMHSGRMYLVDIIFALCVLVLVSSSGQQHKKCWRSIFPFIDQALPFETG